MSTYRLLFVFNIERKHSIKFGTAQIQYYIIRYKCHDACQCSLRLADSHLQSTDDNSEQHYERDYKTEHHSLRTYRLSRNNRHLLPHPVS